MDGRRSLPGLARISADQPLSATKVSAAEAGGPAAAGQTRAPRKWLAGSPGEPGAAD